MGFVKGLTSALALATIIGTAAVVSPGFSQTTKQAKPAAPSPAAERGPSSADLVNKALNPGASNPDIPLPHPDLANSTADQPASSTRAQVYGRQEQGGGVLGLRMPIPADRNSTARGY